ncbi:S-adenosyl-L-methionine-dependent methyltransferase, partial [Coemansia spiralis]
MSFYERAADILGRLEHRQGSIKNLTIGNQYLKPEDKRKMYALVCETLKHSSALITIIKRSGIMQYEDIQLRLALVLVHDLLLTRSGLQRMGADIKLNHKISKHKAKLATELANLKKELGATSNADLVPVALQGNASTFRYVRVNLLVSTVDDVVEHFQNEGYKLIKTSKTGDRSNINDALKAKSHAFMRDLDLHDLLVFPSGTDLHAHPLYLNGSIILQDKASCMPAHVVHPAAGSTALDACAAPGNKTSHMASLMGNKGNIFAFDMDRRRLDTLVKLTGDAKCQIITAQCMSFLDVDPLDPRYANVEYALLDPSCSGSGIVNRLDALVDTYICAVNNKDAEQSDGTNGEQKERLRNLAEFQTSVILHSMRFPNVKRISYSTCSIHEVENENVVSRVLKDQSEFGLAPVSDVIPTWPRRGLETAGLTKEQASCLVRTLPEDGTNGFFVACFVRQKPADIESTKQQLQAMNASKPASNSTDADKNTQ